MKQKETKRFRTQIAIGYTLTALLLGGIIYTWFSEWRDIGQQEEEYRRINKLRQEVNTAHMRFLELSLLGETVLEWDLADVQLYHSKRLALDSLLCGFKSSYPTERIDSVRILMEDKEEHLIHIMDLFDRQENVNEQIAQQVPVIAEQSTQELIGRIDRKVNEDLQEREAAFIAMQERSFLHIGALT